MLKNWLGLFLTVKLQIFKIMLLSNFLKSSLPLFLGRRGCHWDHICFKTLFWWCIVPCDQKEESHLLIPLNISGNTQHMVWILRESFQSLDRPLLCISMVNIWGGCCQSLNSPIWAKVLCNLFRTHFPVFILVLN